MVFDPITEDWVPRYGTGSIKHIEDAANIIMEEKPKHLEAGMDPFTFKKMEKKMVKEKQNLRELKNKVLADGVNAKAGAKGKDQILNQSAPNAGNNGGAKEEGEVTESAGDKTGKTLPNMK